MTKQPNPPRAATRTRRHQTIILTPSTGPAGPCVSLITGKVFELPPDANEFLPLTPSPTRPRRTPLIPQAPSATTPRTSRHRCNSIRSILSPPHPPAFQTPHRHQEAALGSQAKDTRPCDATGPAEG